jgi:hypothetical protein
LRGQPTGAKLRELCVDNEAVRSEPRLPRRLHRHHCAQRACLRHLDNEAGRGKRNHRADWQCGLRTGQLNKPPRSRWGDRSILGEWQVTACSSDLRDNSTWPIFRTRNQLCAGIWGGESSQSSRTLRSRSRLGHLRPQEISMRSFLRVSLSPARWTSRNRSGRKRSW